ncbi:MAG: hypothetical protein O7B99_07590, partial [Planctomycetota bacterium]|nr:hypothetical protein [Planctomycetota bacterium]
TPAEMVDVIRTLEYEPEIVGARGGLPVTDDVAMNEVRVDASALPAELRERFAAAERSQRLVLLDFTGPW